MSLKGIGNCVRFSSGLKETWNKGSPFWWLLRLLQSLTLWILLLYTTTTSTSTLHGDLETHKHSLIFSSVHYYIKLELFGPSLIGSKMSKQIHHLKKNTLNIFNQLNNNDIRNSLRIDGSLFSFLFWNIKNKNWVPKLITVFMTSHKRPIYLIAS